MSADPEKHIAPRSGDRGGDTSSPVLAVLRNPLLIGSACALLWCILMTAALCLYRRHSGSGFLGAGRKRSKGEGAGQRAMRGPGDLLHTLHTLCVMDVMIPFHIRTHPLGQFVVRLYNCIIIDTMMLFKIDMIILLYVYIILPNSFWA